jgi:peptidyl-prolyl cis-trans isomerase B (cyclophilin B)
MHGHKFPAWQREWYESVGGTPQLDQAYTAYGEVVYGLDMVDRIAAVKKDERDRPTTDVPMTVELLSKKECKRLDELIGLIAK